MSSRCGNTCTLWFEPLSAAACAVLMHAAQVEGAVRTSSSSGLQGKDVILEYYRRYNAGDVDGVMELMAPECQCAVRSV